MGWTETEAWGFTGESRLQGTNVQETGMWFSLKVGTTKGIHAC